MVSLSGVAIARCLRSCLDQVRQIPATAVHFFAAQLVHHHALALDRIVGNAALRNPFFYFDFGAANDDRNIVPSNRFVHAQAWHNDGQFVVPNLMMNGFAVRDCHAHAAKSVQDSDDDGWQRVAFYATAVSAALTGIEPIAARCTLLV
jgi:hypothetical protein